MSSTDYNNLGATLAMQGKLAEAVAAFERAVALSPDDPASHRNLARATNLAGTGSTDDNDLKVYVSTDGHNFTPATTTSSPTASTSDGSTTVTGLTAGTTYYFYVQTDSSSAVFSVRVHASTATLAAAPSGLVATPGDGVAYLTWTPVANATSYNVYADDGDGTGYNLLTSTTTPGLVASSTYDGSLVVNGTTYNFEVSAVVDGVEGAKASTSCTPAAPGIASLSAAIASTSEIDLAWSTAGEGDAIEVDYSTDGVTFSPLVTGLSNTTTSYTASNLQDGTVYYFRVGTYTAPASGATAFTAPLTTTTNYAIADLQATDISANSISLSWDGLPDGVSLLELFRSTDGGPFDFLTDSNLSDAFNSSSPPTGFTDSTVEEGHDYSYELQATMTDGSLTQVSEPSDALTTAIQNLSYTPTATSITLNWTDLTPAAGPITSIELGTNSAEAGAYTFTSLTSLSALTATISGLTENTPIWCELQITDGAGTAVTGPLEAWTLPNAPGTRSVSMTAGTVVLTWTDTNGGDVPYYVEQSTDGTNFTIIGETDDGATTFTDNDPTDGTSEYIVSAVNGDSSASNDSTATSVSNTLLAPSDLTAEAQSADEVDLSWTNNSTAADGLTIERSTNGGSYASLTSFTDPTVDTHADTSCSAGNNYSYEIVATQTGEPPSAVSSSANDTTTPPAPTGLTATVASSSEIDLGWTAASGAAGYTIQRAASGGTNWQTIATVTGGTTTSYPDTGLWDNTTYSYQIAAYNNAGSSGYASSATATTSKTLPAAPTLNGAVILTPATSTNDGAAQIVWTNNAYNEDSFEVYRNDGTGWSDYATVAKGADTYIDTSLAYGTGYEYKVAAVNSIGSAFSSAVYPVVGSCEWYNVTVLQNAAEEGDTSHGFFEISRPEAAIDTLYGSGAEDVTYDISGTATAGSSAPAEYQALSGTVHFDSGQTNAIVTLTPNEINKVESNTNVTVTLSGHAAHNSSPYFSSNSVATATIVNTDDETIAVPHDSLDVGIPTGFIINVTNHYGRPSVDTLALGSGDVALDLSDEDVASDTSGVAEVTATGSATTDSPVVSASDSVGNTKSATQAVAALSPWIRVESNWTMAKATARSGEGCTLEGLAFLVTGQQSNWSALKVPGISSGTAALKPGTDVDVTPLLRAYDAQLRSNAVAATQNFQVKTFRQVTPLAPHQDQAAYVESFFRAGTACTSDCQGAAVLCLQEALVETLQAGEATYLDILERKTGDSGYAALVTASKDYRYGDRTAINNAVGVTGDWAHENLICLDEKYNGVNTQYWGFTGINETGDFTFWRSVMVRHQGPKTRPIQGMSGVYTFWNVALISQKLFDLRVSKGEPS